MFQLGKLGDVEEIFGRLEQLADDRLQGCLDTEDRPTAMPTFDQDGEYLLVSFSRVHSGELHDEVYVIECESLEDMQEVHDRYSAFGNLIWYVGSDRALETITEAEGYPTA